ncbi:bifunctional methylenetetrahydrofolate dehydrogenase/methenyltetrahydrofolate cyclohydrolase FolD [Marinomonas balearica]|uniref:Bifunctional protein FolD n=1 Tax=Marinomonas balearica TaxID=491947 RepID=A0A4R6M264_9GAMM|nr:bifunctional methylenetetrahydrofolate dehydrogenase/methenyltetrahydrofolate cyclohydrolase FolD [Marinomonas balearica]TDO95337.1 methylenetetrahydrofolate dehydrogenase (NADP+)/methenyltetrahydrofolate cyclohydrolase [Marinomonas balearica]
MADRIDGKRLANGLIQGLTKEVEQFKASHNVVPGLAVVLVGHDPASQVYVSSKVKRAKEAGLNSIEHYLSEDCSQSELDGVIEQLNSNPNVHGILVQLPLPSHLCEKKVIESIAPEKDVDGFHPQNVGRLGTGEASLTPCTPLGCMLMLRQHFGDCLSGLSGKHAVVIGRSNIVGKPMAQLLLQANCTVTVVHSRTQNIESLCQQADILIAAVGQPEMVKSSWVKTGAVVIDVGINAISRDGKRKLVGDVEFDSVSGVASALSPVPGGVGPMTIACLMQNTLTAAKNQINLPTNKPFSAQMQTEM